MDGQGVERGDKLDQEELAFLPKGDAGDESCCESGVLTKEDLLRIDKEEPVWRRVRIALISIFWIVWFGLIVASALFIVFTPKCPPRPSQQFWESKVGYWVNPFSFVDSDGDLVGDLKGLADAAEYIQEEVGAGFVVLTSLSPLYPKSLMESGKSSLKGIHPTLGSMEDFHYLLRSFKKRGMQVVVTLNFNSVPVAHELAKPEFLTASTANDKFCRADASPKEAVDGQYYYSTYGSGSGVVDLNLQSAKVMDELKNATRFWLSKGVDGILLEDAAFFVEEGLCSGDSWFAELPTCKLYTQKTLTVVSDLRKVIDEFSSSTSRPRVLFADPGNTGYGPNGNVSAELLLGTEEAPGAHVVISRHFAFNSGASNVSASPSVSAYSSSVNSSLAGQLALTIASPSDRPYADIFSTASVFLLPGTPLVYAGTEIGWNPISDVPSGLYPFGERPIVDDVASKLPMPWDSHGAGFSKSEKVSGLYQNYTEKLNVTETVETSMAAGRGPSIFNLSTTLIRLYKEEPSLLWGGFSRNVTEHPSVEVFKRSAAGFDSVVVVMVDADGFSVVDFTSECATLVPVVVYPPNELFPIGEALSSVKVYFKPASCKTVYVFKCAV
uniref:Aamy domain-containing protein n=1 Tax=Mesocestoides corti TaxID=53468 RepID=A0A5K3EI40_MESCO